MPKIDTTQIKGYAEMTAEQKLAALEGYEYNDNAAELERSRAAVTKANGEAAEWKRKHNALLSEDEQKKQEREEQFNAMKAECEALKRKDIVSGYTAKFLARGFDEKLAGETALAMAEGNFDTVFANEAAFDAQRADKIKQELLKTSPRTPAGTGGTSDYSSKIADAQKRGDMATVAYYVRKQQEETK